MMPLSVIAPEPAERVVDGDSLWNQSMIEALLRVSRTVAAGTQLHDVLRLIAREACVVTGSKSASILLSDKRTLQLAASVGLSPEYVKFLESHFVSHGHGAAGAASDSLKPIVIDDMRVDQLVNAAPEWKGFALREGYLSMASVPLVAGRRARGVLNLYRAEAGPWLRESVDLLVSFGQQAASAIDGVKLIDAQRQQLVALERLVSILQDQTHEYANRLHALSGLLALDAKREAKRFLAELIHVHHENYAAVVDRLHHPIVAGLMLAEMDVARQRGVELRLHGRSQLYELPPALGDAEAVTILANLVENAVEVAAAMAPARRRVACRITQGRHNVVFAVRDWGPGFPRGDHRDAFRRGVSHKNQHLGIGLALVDEAVASAHGTISVERHEQGVTIKVVVPHG